MEKQATGTNVAIPEKNFFERYGEAMTPNTIVGQLLVFNKFGEYTSGQDKTDVPIGTRVVAYLPSLKTGWIRWSDNRPTDTRMGLIVDGFVPPTRAELGDTDADMWDRFDDGRPKDPWQFTNHLLMLDVEDSTVYTFTTASKGGLGAIGELAKAYGQNIKLAPDKVPVIALGMSSYKHSNKAYGEIRVPEFEVVGWVEAPPELVHAGEAPQEAKEQPRAQKALPLPKGRGAAPARPPARQAVPIKGGGGKATGNGRKSIRFGG